MKSVTASKVAKTKTKTKQLQLYNARKISNPKRKQLQMTQNENLENVKRETENFEKWKSENEESMQKTGLRILQ